MTTSRLLGCALLCAASVGQGLAQPAADLQRCRALVDNAARLACYDALPLVPAAAARAGTATAAGSASEAATRPAQPAAAAFGLPQPREELAEITSRIVGAFEGWSPNARIRLANGQIWQIADDSSAVYDLRDPPVKVRRAVLGSFMLEIEGARRAPRVRRVE